MSNVCDLKMFVSFNLVEEPIIHNTTCFPRSKILKLSPLVIRYYTLPAMRSSQYLFPPLLQSQQFYREREDSIMAASSSAAIRTRITSLFSCKYPLILPGMSWISEPALVAAVSNAGEYLT